MLARLQQFITLGLILAAGAWATIALSQGDPVNAFTGAALILSGYAVVLGVEFVWMFLVNQRDSVPGPTRKQTLAAWWGEVRTAPAVFCWAQPFRSLTHPDCFEGRPGQRGVLLVHGFVCNRGLWNSWYARLAKAGIPHVAVNLEPVFGDIDLYAPAIDKAVQALIQATGVAPVIVAHSMGGLAVRAWIRTQGADLARVHHVITLGTPHHGTVLARFGLTPNAMQMRRHNDWLSTLSLCETAALRSRFTCVYSACDNIVFPSSTAILPDAAAIAIPACAHVHMVVHPAAFEAVMARLTAPSLPIPAVMPARDAERQDPRSPAQGM